jgi:small Trp-rich protein
MLFIGIGVLMILSNLLGIGPLASWNWELTGDFFKFCIPFGLAVVWWIWSDKSGLDKRREIEKMEAKKRSRRDANLVSLGIDKNKQRKGGKQ